MVSSPLTCAYWPTAQSCQVVNVHRVVNDVSQQFGFVSIGEFRRGRLTFYRIMGMRARRLPATIVASFGGSI